MHPECAFYAFEFAIAVIFLCVGKWGEAAKWRSKAESGQFRESAGKIYRVTRVE